MIQTYGRGEATGLVAPLTHHAAGVSVIATALMNALLTSQFARDEKVHRLHIGKGGNSVNLHLAEHTKPTRPCAGYAFRARRSDGAGYDRIEILDAVQEGDVVFTITDPKQVPKAIKTMERAL